MAKLTDVVAKAKQAAKGLKHEYEAGKRGDESPITPLWASPKEQLDAVLGLLRSAAGSTAGPATGTGSREGPDAVDATDAADAADAEELETAIRSIDWAGVRAATSEKSGDATRVMKSMADQVDWSKVTPIASHVSSALIAAVASGHLPVGGRIGGTVARAIVDQRGMGQRVARQMQADQVPMPPDFRGVLGAIDTTARDV